PQPTLRRHVLRPDQAGGGGGRRNRGAGRARRSEDREAARVPGDRRASPRALARAHGIERGVPGETIRRPAVRGSGRGSRGRWPAAGSDDRAHAPVLLRRSPGGTGRQEEAIVGLLKELVLLPLAPVRGVAWLSERIAEAAELERGDPESIRRQMIDAELAYERGDIDERELARIEESLLDRLEVRDG